MTTRLLLVAAGLALAGQTAGPALVAETTIDTWQDGKRGAVTLTYDDSNINQFRVALPLMNERRLPATFFVITGGLEGARYAGRFVGRAPAEILRESATVPTNATNYLERISAAPFLGYEGLITLHNAAAPPTAQTFARVDAAYAKARNGELPKLAPNAFVYMDNKGDPIQAPPSAEGGRVTWDQLRAAAAQGHEIGSHTVTHPHLDALDEANILDELTRSRDEIRDHLGTKHLFSAECPFGIEDPRAVGYALKIYPALRNRMPEPWLEELDRSSRGNPTASTKPYVQWQRGAISTSTPETIKGWIDTTADHENIWLVFVIHGVEGIGWEALTRHTLTMMYDHIVANQDRLWVATFGDVTRYMRERMNAKVTTAPSSDGTIRVTLTHALDPALYDLPLTLNTPVPAAWARVVVTQGAARQTLAPVRDTRGSSVTYHATPNGPAVSLSPR